MTISRDQIQDLRELAEAWPNEIVLIGAAALGFSHGMAWRATSDLDLVIATDQEGLRQALPAGWQRTRIPHRIVGACGTRFDIVPASSALRSARSLDWGDGRVMNLTGIELAFRHAVDHDCHGHRLKVAPPAVIVVLKMISYLDRPAERTRDLKDIAHLLDEYIGDDDDRRFDEGLGTGLDFALIPAYLLGKDVAEVAGRDAVVVDAVHRFLALVEGVAHGELRHQAPNRWRSDDDAGHQRLSAFRRGIEEGDR